jgi:carboxypeptidase PM20D1
MKSSNLAKILLKSLLIISITLVSAVHLRAQNNEQMFEGVHAESFSEAASILSKYVAISSETGNENLAAYFFRDLCQEKGLYIETITDSIGSVNFAASLYPLSSKKPNIILLNHIDVVQAEDSPEWIYPPYSGTIADGKVWGRGSFDNKGLAVTQLFAIEKFIHQAVVSPLHYNVTLLSVSGEETGGVTGSAIVAKNFKEIFTPAVVIGEGGSGIDGIKFLPLGKTFFGISVAEKGFVWLKMSCNIQTDGHASLGGNDYAIKRMVDALYKLSNKRQPIQMLPLTKQMFKGIGKNTGGLKGFAIKHVNFPLFKPFLRQQIRKNPELELILCDNITISNIEVAKSFPNQNPQEAFAMLDCRYLPNSHPDKIIAEVKKIINDSVIHISIERKGSPQYETTPEFFYDELKQAVIEIFPNSVVLPVLFPASSDNSYYRTWGCPVYGLNPMIVSTGQIQAIHNYNEYIDLDDIENGIKVFENFLESVQKSGSVPNPEKLTHRQ